MSAKIPFLLNEVDKVYLQGEYDGIAGFSPKDESAGPLFLDYLYQQKKIKQKVFAILPTRSMNNLPKITFGGYQTENSFKSD